MRPGKPHIIRFQPPPTPAPPMTLALQLMDVREQLSGLRRTIAATTDPVQLEALHQSLLLTTAHYVQLKLQPQGGQP